MARDRGTLPLHILVAAALVSAGVSSAAAAPNDRWGIEVTLTPAVTKAGHTVDFTVTLQNSGNLTVTVCQIDVHFIWNANPQTVFEGSQNILPDARRSWTFPEAIPRSLTPGGYHAKITVTAKFTSIPPDCEPNDWIRPIEIVPNILPNASFFFEPRSPMPNAIVQFIDNSTDDDGNITAWHWNFGDGTNSTLQDPVHQFTQAGSYDVVLAVRDDSDGAGQLTQTVQVSPNLLPVAGFSYAPQPATTSTSVQFSDGSSDPDGRIVRWHWEFGDGASSIEQNPSHRFPSAGNYPVSLTVTDDRGASNSFTQTVVVASSAGGTNPRGFGLLEWGLTGAIVASTAVVAAFLIKKKVRPSRRWGQALSPPPPNDSKRRWRPR